MSICERKTHVPARDCVEDTKHTRLIFVVDKDMVGAAIGKGGTSIRAVQDAIKRDIEIVGHSEDPEEFLVNVLRPKLVNKVKINKREDGTMTATVMVNPGNKALAIGREGRNATKAKILAQRYFGISHVSIEDAEAAGAVVRDLN